MTTQPYMPNRWQFRLSTLLLFTAVIGIAIGWCLDRQRLKVEVQTAHEEADTTYMEVWNELATEMAEVERLKLELEQAKKTSAAR
jgi:uncharacterized membrane protein YciS (DUF1049 family)